MEMRIRESNGAFKVTITSLAGRELAVYGEASGSLTFELREVEDVETVEAFELERVPIFNEEVAAVAPQEEDDAIAQEVKEVARDNALFHKLSGLRRELATAEKVPPYMIFHDKTLWYMVEAMPVDLPNLGRISGVGKAKLEKYGGKFLAALQEGA